MALSRKLYLQSCDILPCAWIHRFHSFPKICSGKRLAQPSPVAPACPTFTYKYSPIGPAIACMFNEETFQFLSWDNGLGLTKLHIYCFVRPRPFSQDETEKFLHCPATFTISLNKLFDTLRNFMCQLSNVLIRSISAKLKSFAMPSHRFH